MAGQLIESLDGEFDATAFHDTYRDKVMDLIERKAAGDEGLVEAPAAIESNKVVDLMAALEASVAAAKKSRGRHPTGKDDAEAREVHDADEVDEVAAKKTASAKGTRTQKSA